MTKLKVMTVATPNKAVNRAFQKGLQLIYKELFQYIYLRFMDESKTKVDSVYGETTLKVYKPPIKMLGHYVRRRSYHHEPVLKTDERETFKIPVQEFYDHNVGFRTAEEIEALRKAVIQFSGFTYKIDEVNPRSVVAGDFLIVTLVASPAEDYISDEYDDDEDLKEVAQENA